MQNKKVLQKTISDIVPTLTGHGVGEKRVLLTQKEHISPITQIAQTHLQAGSDVESHTHETMDEHFIFLYGKCKVKIDKEIFFCEGGQYLFVPAGIIHQIEVLTDTELITIGVATE